MDPSSDMNSPTNRQSARSSSRLSVGYVSPIPVAGQVQVSDVFTLQLTSSVGMLQMWREAFMSTKTIWTWGRWTEVPTVWISD